MCLIRLHEAVGLDGFGWSGSGGGRKGYREEELTGEHRKQENSPARRKLTPTQK